MTRTLRVFVAILILSAIVYPLLGHQTSILIFGNSAQLAGLGYALFHFLRLTSFSGKKDPLHSAWARCAFGLFIWLMAQLLEFYCEMVLNMIAYGTVADAFWVIGYFPVIAGFQKILKHSKAGGQPVRMAWILLFSIAAYVLLFVFLILPQWQEPQAWGEAILDFSYPTFDFVLLVQAFLIMKYSQTRAAWRFAVFSQFAFLLTMAGDAILSLIQNFDSFIYKSIDIYYFSCYFMLALAAEHRSAEFITEKTQNLSTQITESTRV